MKRTDPALRTYRKRWTANEKLRVVLDGLAEGADEVQICEREGIHLKTYHTWKRQLSLIATQYFDHNKKLGGMLFGDNHD